ncbi:MAG: SDR family oxidoreductase, partial [Candidatus Bathyarchaeota archaeon]|nr:SDR family oxidoreductase [Candidatus Bathyarchaeota archaeon]
AAGYSVKVLDLYIYGDDVLDNHPALVQVKGDIRDRELLKREIPGNDAIIHLAYISNDPSYELDPQLGKSINYDAFAPLVDIAKKNGVRRFIFASSSSVYGIKDEVEVTEDLIPEPITDYSLCKAECEKILLSKATDSFIVTIIRPGTVCGYSPRMRLDLVLNILTHHGIRGKITVFGGKQIRGFIHIEDMTELYKYLLELPEKRIQGKIYNAGWENHTVMELAQIVRKTISDRVSITVMPSDDNRSYRICSKKIESELRFFPIYTIKDAILDMERAINQCWLSVPLDNIKYYNVKTMRAVKLR